MGLPFVDGVAVRPARGNIGFLDPASPMGVVRLLGGETRRPVRAGEKKFLEDSLFFGKQGTMRALQPLVYGGLAAFWWGVVRIGFVELEGSQGFIAFG